MQSFMVTYDLIKRKDYPELWDALKSFPGYLHILGSVWIVKANASAEQVFDYLRPHIDDDDKMIVVLLQREAKWSLSFPKNVHDWIQNYL
jgi:hypothetical protein